MKNILILVLKKNNKLLLYYIMRIIQINILIFLFGSFLGWCLENCLGIIQRDKVLISRNRCGDWFVTQILKQCFPFLTIYGYGLLLVFNTFVLTRYHLSTFLIICLCLFLVVFLECFVAVINYHYLKKKTWDYGTNLCYGGIGVIQTFYWFLLLTFVILFFNKFLPSNIY